MYVFIQSLFHEHNSTQGQYFLVKYIWFEFRKKTLVHAFRTEIKKKVNAKSTIQD